MSPSFTKRALIVVALAASAVILLGLLWHVANLLLLVFGGLLFAIFLDALIGFVADHTHVGSLGSKIAVLVGLVLLFGLLGWWLGPRVVAELGSLGDTLPTSWSELREWLRGNQWTRSFAEYLPAREQVSGALWSRIAGIFSTGFGALASAAFMLLVGLYIALEPKVYQSGWLHLVPPARRERAAEVERALGHALRRWLLGRFASMAAIGALTTVGLLILGVGTPLALGLIAGLFSFVPFIGPIASAIPAILVALIQDPTLALGVVALYAGIQALEGNVITPLIQREAVSMPPSLLLTAQATLGVLAGLLGVLLATPLAVAIIVLVQTLYVQDALDEPVRLLGEKKKE